jgi:hypothetical protein
LQASRAPKSLKRRYLINAAKGAAPLVAKVLPLYMVEALEGQGKI